MVEGTNFSAKRTPPKNSEVQNVCETLNLEAEKPTIHCMCLRPRVIYTVCDSERVGDLGIEWLSDSHSDCVMQSESKLWMSWGESCRRSELVSWNLLCVGNYDVKVLLTLIQCLQSASPLAWLPQQCLISSSMQQCSPWAKYTNPVCLTSINTYSVKYGIWTLI